MKDQLLLSGKHVLISLKDQIKKDAPKKIFLVTGKESYYKSGANIFIDCLLDGFSFIRYNNFKENPQIDEAQIGIKIFNENNCDYIISIGGGSVIDMAKLITIGQANGCDLRELIFNKDKRISKGEKFIAIPTTAGSGSEATHFAVLYIENKKYSIAHSEFMLPDIVALVPSLSLSNSKKQTALSGVDAFSQAIESYWSNNSTIESRNYSIEAINIILNNLPNAVNENCEFSKEKLLLGSYLAGRAINIAKTTGAHALSYTFTSKYKIPHGQAVALTLIEWLEFNCNIKPSNIVDNRGFDYVNKTMTSLKMLLSGSENTSITVNKLNIFFHTINISTSIADFNINSDDFKFIVENVNLERLKNNPILVNETDLYTILNRSLTKKNILN